MTRTSPSSLTTASPNARIQSEGYECIRSTPRVAGGDSEQQNMENKVEKYNKMKNKIFSGMSSLKSDKTVPAENDQKLDENDEKLSVHSIAEDEVLSGQE